MLRPVATRLPTLALAAGFPTGPSLRHINRLARPSACIANTCTNTFTTTSSVNLWESFHAANQTSAKTGPGLTSAPTSQIVDKNARSISAIAQRLPSEKETKKTSHRFREFEAGLFERLS